MNKRIDIPAVHDKDLRKVLDKYNASEKIDNKEIYCVLCNKIITWDNLFAFKVVEKNLVFFCDEPNCIELIKT